MTLQLTTFFSNLLPTAEQTKTEQCNYADNYYGDQVCRVVVK